MLLVYIRVKTVNTSLVHTNLIRINREVVSSNSKACAEISISSVLMDYIISLIGWTCTLQNCQEALNILIYWNIFCIKTEFLFLINVNLTDLLVESRKKPITIPIVTVQLYHNFKLVYFNNAKKLLHHTTRQRLTSQIQHFFIIKHQNKHVS